MAQAEIEVPQTEEPSKKLLIQFQGRLYKETSTGLLVPLEFDESQ